MHPITIMLIAQSATGAIEPGIKFDLAKIRPAESCSSSVDIVVCGRKRKTGRVGALPDIELPSPAKAEIKLFGDVKASAGLEGSNVGGFVSNRLMARVKIPL